MSSVDSMRTYVSAFGHYHRNIMQVHNSANEVVQHNERQLHEEIQLAFHLPHRQEVSQLSLLISL